MIKTIIVDDEQHCTDRLINLLKTNYDNSISIIGSFSTVSMAYKGIRKLKPDLLFLDIQIHDRTGFDLLRELGKIDFQIIFTTAFDKFAVQAFKFSALDYLLKPVDADDLRQAIEKFQERNFKSGNEIRLDTLLSNLNLQNTNSKRLIVPTISGFEVLEIADIVQCQSDINYTTIFMKGRQKLVVAKTLKEFEEMLSDYNFFRVHNSHLINLMYVKNYQKGKGGSVALSDGTVIEVSTRRKDAFLQKMSTM